MKFIFLSQNQFFSSLKPFIFHQKDFLLLSRQIEDTREFMANLDLLEFQGYFSFYLLLVMRELEYSVGEKRRKFFVFL